MNKVWYFELALDGMTMPAYSFPSLPSFLSVARRSLFFLKPVTHGSHLAATLLSKTPPQIYVGTMTRVMNDALQPLLADGEFDFLINRSCRITLDDVNLHWNLRSDGESLMITEGRQAADVIIHGSLTTFLLLISQKVDPDTLFFQRKLSIEGDVELGLLVKNLLDTLDHDELSNFWQRFLNMLSFLIQQEHNLS